MGFKEKKKRKKWPGFGTVIKKNSGAAFWRPR